MLLVQFSELGRQEALALVKKILCAHSKIRKPSCFLMGCTYNTMNRLMDGARDASKAGLAT